MSEMIAAFSAGVVTTHNNLEENLSQKESRQTEQEQHLSPPSYQETCPASKGPPGNNAKQLPTVPVISSESEWKPHFPGTLSYWSRELKENGHISTQYAIGPEGYSRKSPGPGPSSSNPPEVLITCKRQPLAIGRCKAKAAKHAVETLALHRDMHSCACDFEYLGDRVQSNVVYRDTGVGSRGKRCDRTKRPLTGFFVRAHMRFHDQDCACGCFEHHL